MKRTMAVILAGGEGERLSILSQERAKPAVPVRRQVPDHRLHAVELRQLGHPRRRRPDPVQPALAQRPHRAGPAVGPRPQPRRREAAPAVHRPGQGRRVVPRHGGRRAAQHERRRARPVGRRRGPRRRPHLQDGLPAVHRGPPAPPRRRDDRRPPGAARRGVADGHPRARRHRPRHRVAGEAQAAQERPRLDGRLRLLEEGPASLAVRGPGRLRARHHPGDARGRRPRLRLPLQRLLAGRRHDPVVLGGQHGAPGRRPRARPVRQGLAHPHPLRGARAGQGRADGPGPSLA